jgi:N-acetylmuramoyl-L-alanine amidase
MKKIILSFIILLCVPDSTPGEVYLFKLKSNLSKDSLRIVLQGPESILTRAIVNQRSERIIVTIPDTVFTIQQDKEGVVYRKKSSDTVVFYPGNFRRLKVFSLKNPYRLVMDVYMTGRIYDQKKPYIKGDKKEPEGAFMIRTIIIDPGHGGYDNGIVMDNYSEKNIVLDIAQKLGALLESETTQTILTRTIDQYMSQKERVSLANIKEPDIFLTLHVGNHSNITLYFPVISDDMSDVSSQYLFNRGQVEYMEESTLLLKAMKEALVAEFGDETVVVRPLPYSVLSRVQAAALMIELPSFEDASYIKEFRVEVATSIYKGLYIYEERKTQ